MTAAGQSLPTAPVGDGRHARSVVDGWVRRRIGVIWALLFFNGLAWIELSVGTVLPIHKRVAQLLTAGALACALVLAISLNRRLTFRPNVVLGGFTLLAAVALMASVRGTAGLGAVLRSFRLAAFLAVLWLLTPWWGRRDLLLARCHLRALLAVCASVVAGLVIAPSLALGFNGRLIGVLWPIPAPQVGQYAAVAAGMMLVLWLSGSTKRKHALLVSGGGVAIVVLTQTRTALIALVAGVVCAALTLFLARQRVRRVATVVLVAAPMVVIALAPAVSSWFTRGQSEEQIAGLTGRRQVWEKLLVAPRSEFNQWFGFGLSDKSFGGHSIDSSWLALYQEQGLVGTAIVAFIVLFLLVALAFRPAGPERALATFLIVYCAVASYTEVGLGDASPYVLHLIVAASLLAPVEHGGEDYRLLSGGAGTTAVGRSP